MADFAETAAQISEETRERIETLEKMKALALELTNQADNHAREQTLIEADAISDQINQILKREKEYLEDVSLT